MMVDAPAQPPTGKQMVDTWVEERLRELGFDDVQAVTLRMARADWHQAARLLDLGCDHDLVVRVLT